ncbi:MAG: trehalose-phosphatase [Actinomycetota bacterium]
MLGPLRERSDRAGVLLDFDGSLSPIVARPDDAAPVRGAREVLAALAARYRLVALVSGRPSDELVARIDVPGLAYVGLYGLEAAAPELTHALLPRVETAAAVVPEAWVEDKRVSVAVHYRQTSDPAGARRALVVALEPVAADAGMHLIEGKMVLELVPPDRPLKGGAVRDIVGAHGLEAVLYAGDDVADLDAFSTLDQLTTAGTHVVKVAVRGTETPAELLERADLVVDGPEGLVELLRSLV